MFKYVELGTAWQTLFRGKLASVSPRYSSPCFLDEDLCLTSYVNKSSASSLAFQFRWNKDCIILIKNHIKGAVWISLYFIPQLDAKTLAIFSRFSANSLVFDSGHYVLLVSFLSFFLIIIPRGNFGIGFTKLNRNTLLRRFHISICSITSMNTMTKDYHQGARDTASRLPLSLFREAKT